jgi:hypothetical protein
MPRKKKSAPAEEIADDNLIPDPDDEMVEVDANSKGDTFLPGVKPVVSKRLKKLGDLCKQKRDGMLQLRNEYVVARDDLIEEMRRTNVPTYDLDDGDTVVLNEKWGIKITKKKTNVSEIDKLDVE